MLKYDLLKDISTANIFGICSVDEYNKSIEKLNESKYNKITDYKSILTFGYSYPSETVQKVIGKGILSSYSSGTDYHIVLLNKLKDYISSVSIRDIDYKIQIDSTFINERLCANLSGFGVKRKNSFIMNDIYGSYYFIGIILVNQEVDFYDSPLIDNFCDNCNICISSCPTDCLSNLNFDNCLSKVSQSKKIFNKETLYKLSEMSYGCDICQQVCPKNKGVNDKSNTEFDHKGLSIDIKELLNMTNKQFSQKYGNTSCAYKGKLVMQRNVLGTILSEGIENYRSELEFLLKQNKDVEWFHTTLKQLLDEGE